MKLRVSQDTYLINDQCCPPEMRVQPCDIAHLMDTLREHHLVTDLTFPDVSKDSDLPIWAEFDLKLNEYLLSIGAEFADPTSFSSCSLPAAPNRNPPAGYHHLPWLLLTGGKLKRQRRYIAPVASLQFSPKTLCSNAVGGVWGPAAAGTPGQPLVLIGASLQKSIAFLCAYVYPT